MSIVVTVTTPGMTAEQYDRVQDVVGLRGTLPEGCTAHIAGPSPEGWRVVAVWDSPEVFRAFATDRLRPAAAEVGIAPPPATPAVHPLHAHLHSAAR